MNTSDNKLSENYRQKIIGGLTPADNCPLDRKVAMAVDFIRKVARQKSDLAVAYSGGKDSEIILHLVKLAKIEYMAYFNNTTIDPPGTLPFIKSHNDVYIRQPRRSFFTLIEHRGLPSTFQRFCCDKLKEVYVADSIITGIRQDESKRRRDKYKEPEACMIYHGGKKCRNYMPILYWTENDVKEFIEAENLRCHPEYYDDNGNFCVHRRLGCMGCPLPYDRGKSHFHRWPKLVRAWCRALSVYRNTRPKLGTTITNFRDEYENFYHNIYNRNLEQLVQQQQNLPRDFARIRLQEDFQVELPPPKSAIEDILKRQNQP